MTAIAGSVAIVTGGASGIGRGSARSLGRRGARVVVADIDEPGAQATAATIRSEGGAAIACRADVAMDDSYERIRDAAQREYGPVDIVMNNAGVLVSGLPQDIPLVEWQRILNINLMSIVRSIHAFVPDMVARRGGHIVNTASTAGLFPYAYERLPYAASKGAVVAMTEALALYLKPLGIGVTLLCPGPVMTNISADVKAWTPGLGFRAPGDTLVLLDPADVGEMVADAIRDDRLFLPTDDGIRELMKSHAADPDAFVAARLVADIAPGP